MNQPHIRIQPWTPAERAERDRLIGALAEALTVPIRQISYRRVAELLGINRSVLIEKLHHHGIPCPAVTRVLTPSEQERIAEIRKVFADDRWQFGLAVVAFIREVWAPRPY